MGACVTLTLFGLSKLYYLAPSSSQGDHMSLGALQWEPHQCSMGKWMFCPLIRISEDILVQESHWRPEKSQTEYTQSEQQIRLNQTAVIVYGKFNKHTVNAKFSKFEHLSGERIPSSLCDKFKALTEAAIYDSSINWILLL